MTGQSDSVKTNKPNIFNVIRIVLEILFMFGISYFLIGVHESMYQVDKDFSFHKALFLMMILIMLIRKVSFAKVRTIVSFLICAAAVAAFIYFKGIRADRYGEIYSKSLRLLTAVWGLFAFLAADSIRKETPVRIRNLAKNPFSYITLTACILAAVFGRLPVPFICPVMLLFLTDIDKEKWMELTDCFAVGFFMAFALYFGASIVKKPFEYDVSGRYIGTFLNINAEGMLCSSAEICILYLFLRWLWSSKRKFSYIIVLIPMTVFATYAVWVVASRSSQMGLALSILAAFVFLHGKSVKTALKRGGISAVLVIISIVCFVILAHYLQNKILNGELKNEDLSYTMAHVANFAVKDKSRGLFKPNTLINAIDDMSSMRLSTWYELGVQIIPFGQMPNADLATHSTYLYWLVKFGAFPGALLILWFVCYGAASCIKAVKNDPTVIMTLLWWALYLGIFVPTNEYWNCPGGLFMLMLMYPLLGLRNVIQKDKGERKVEKQHD